MTSSQPEHLPLITVTGIAARMLEADNGAEIEDQPIPCTLTPLGAAAAAGPDINPDGQIDPRWIDASIRADHPTAPYISYQPTAYDLGITDEPETEPEITP